MNNFVHPISFKVSEETKKKLEKLAAEDRRPLSNLVRNIVEDWLEEREAKISKKPKK